MLTLCDELNKLIDVFEADIPANPQSPKNRRKAISIERIMKQYFANLELALSNKLIKQLYWKYVIQEAEMKPGAWDGIHSTLDPILSILHDSLVIKMVGQLTTIYMDGSAEMVTWGRTLGGVPIAYEGPPIEQAIKWAEKHGAQLVTKMDEESKRRLAKVISDGIKNKRGIPGISRDLRAEFKNMTKHRSELIAKSETRDALFQASHDSMIDMGIDGKEWVLGAGGETGNCDDCIANAAVGIIPVSRDFPTPEGDIHPGCTCAIAPAIL